MAGRITRYSDFWPYYLREHAKPKTRLIHYAGTGFSIISLVAMIATRNPLFLPVAVILGYGPAWFGHFFVEKNKPATFKYPLWSLISDYRMAFTWLAGRLGNELTKAGVARQ